MCNKIALTRFILDGEWYTSRRKARKQLQRNSRKVTFTGAKIRVTLSEGSRKETRVSKKKKKCHGMNESKMQGWVTLASVLNYMDLPNPSISGKMWYKVNFFKRSIADLIFSPRLVAKPRLITQSIFLFSWEENTLIHAFPKGFSTNWNSNSFIKSLNTTSFEVVTTLWGTQFGLNAICSTTCTC